MDGSQTVLCSRCDNRDVEHEVRGHEYRQVPVCLYRLPAFPAATKCREFVPTVGQGE